MRWARARTRPRISQRLRDTVRERFAGRCFWCGNLAIERRGPNNQWWERRRLIGNIDHLTPRSQGGDDSLENLVWSCEECNWSRDKGEAAVIVWCAWPRTGRCRRCAHMQHGAASAAARQTRLAVDELKDGSESGGD